MARRPTLSTSAGLGVGASAGLLSGLSLGRPVLMLVAGVVLAIAGRLGITADEKHTIRLRTP